MSGQPSQRVRRIASPSTKQGPMKATLPFALMQGSPTRATNGRKNSPSSSPTPLWSSESHRVKSRRSPDNRASPERGSPNSPGFKVERPKPIRISPAPSIRRTGSLDTIAGPYLTGQWPRDITSYIPQHGPINLSSDKATQTPEEWEELGYDRKKKGSHKRSASVGNGDTLKDVFKQRLRSTKEHGSKNNSTSNPRQSPIHASHLALTNPTPSSALIQSKAVAIPVAHIPKQAAMPRIRGSVEGLNQEIERLVLMKTNISGMEGEESSTQEPTPDGHRAPIAELISGSTTRTVDTQTPSGFNEDGKPAVLLEEEVTCSSTGSSSSSSSSRPQSESPLSFQMDTSRPSSTSGCKESRYEDTEELTQEESDRRSEEAELVSHFPDLQTSKYAASSPKPNKSYLFVREPPDGCEKVKIVDESIGVKKPLPFCPIRKTGLYHIPSRDSAFCPLYTPYISQSTELVLKSPASPGTTTSIESQ